MRMMMIYQDADPSQDPAEARARRAGQSARVQRSAETALEKIMGLAAVRQGQGADEDEAIAGVLRDYPLLRAAWRRESEARELARELQPEAPKVKKELKDALGKARKKRKQLADDFLNRVQAHVARGSTASAAAKEDPEGYAAYAELSTAGQQDAPSLAKTPVHIERQKDAHPAGTSAPSARRQIERLIEEEQSATKCSWRTALDRVMAQHPMLWDSYVAQGQLPIHGVNAQDQHLYEG